MAELLKGRIHALKYFEYRISGVDKYGFKKEVIISPSHQMETFSLRDTNFRFQIDGETYVMNFRDLDMSKVITPSRYIPELANRRDKHILSAIYDLIAEVSLYKSGLSEKLDLEALKQRYGSCYDNINLDVAVANIESAIKPLG